MAMPARSTDPVEAMLARDTAVDHDEARFRGQRVFDLARRLVSTLDARGLLRGSAQDATVELFHPIADDLYGNAAIDIPALRGRS